MKFVSAPPLLLLMMTFSSSGLFPAVVDASSFSEDDTLNQLREAVAQDGIILPYDSFSRRRQLGSPKGSGKCSSKDIDMLRAEPERRRKLHDGGKRGSSFSSTSSFYDDSASLNGDLPSSSTIRRREHQRRKLPSGSSKGGGGCNEPCFPGDAVVEVWDDASQSFVATKMKDAKVL